MKLNKHYSELEESYLFSTIARKVADYQAAHPDKDIIRLGIGDVTLPLAPAVVDAMHSAVTEMGCKETFHGYIPSEQGYTFLREAIQKYYAERGVALDLSEIFISDGAKSDLGNLLDLFEVDNTVLVPDPVYPVYVDDNVMAGRKILYLPATAENGFLPMPTDAPDADIVYICSPNNPTGATYTVAQLGEWVAWAKARGAVILFDAAYECFVTEDGLARSIYEVEGAKEVAVEVCSFSKIAVGLKQRRHLVDKGPGAARADSVHALVDTAGKVNDLGVLAAQLDGHVRLRRVVLQGGSHSHHLLDKGNFQMGGQGQAAGAGDHGDDLHGAGVFTGLSQQACQRFLYIGIMPLIVGK